MPRQDPIREALYYKFDIRAGFENRNPWSQVSPMERIIGYTPEKKKKEDKTVYDDRANCEVCDWKEERARGNV
jgi:hypothetical protein